MLSANQIKHLDHLADILNRLDKIQASRILSDLRSDIQFNPEALRYLLLKVYIPARLFADLTDDDLKLILRQLKPSTLKGLVKIITEDDKQRITRLLGREKISDARSALKYDSYTEVMQCLYDYLGLYLSRGEIAYNGPALLLIVPPCSSPLPDTRTKTKIFFQVLNPLVTPGNGFWVLVYIPGKPNFKLRLSCKKAENRYFYKGDRAYFKTIELNSYGLFFGRLLPEEKDGPVNLWLEIPGIGQVYRTILYTRKARALFTINITNVILEESGQKTISFDLHSTKLEFKNQNIRYGLYCTGCGIPIKLGFTQLAGNTGRITYLDQPMENSHPHSYYLHIFYNNHQAGTFIDVHTRPTTIVTPQFPIKEGWQKIPEHTIQINLPVEDYEQVFYHLTTNPVNNQTLINLISTSRITLCGKQGLRPRRKPSPLELSLQTDELLLLSTPNEYLKAATFFYNKQEGFSYKHEGIENIYNLYFTFYRITASGLEPFSQYISHVQKEPFIWPELPIYLGKDERVTVDMGYYMPVDNNLTISNGRDKKIKLRGRGIIPLLLKGNDKIQIEWQSSEFGKSKKSIDFTGQQREYEMISFQYAPPGTIIDPKNNNYDFEIFGSVEDLYLYFLNKELLNYPWGCAEQTSAKITGFCLKLIKSSIPKQQEIFIQHIKKGITHLLTFQNEKGLFTLFGKNYNISTTLFVYKNFLPILPFKHQLKSFLPQLFELIEDIQKLLDNHNIKMNRQLKSFNARVQNAANFSLAISTQYSLYILNTTPQKLRLIDDKLNYRVKDLYSLSAYCCQVLAALLDQKQDSIHIFARRSIKNRIIYRTGLWGLLERLGIIKPRIKRMENIESKILKPAHDYLLNSIQPAHLSSSTCSTVEITSLLLLLDKIKQRINSYQYEENGKPLVVEKIKSVTQKIKVLTPFTFIKIKTKKIPIPSPGEMPFIRITSRTMSKGQITRVHYQIKSNEHQILRFLLPFTLQPMPCSGIRYHDQSVWVNPGNNGELCLIAKRVGMGHLKLLIEKMYRPAETALIDLGQIEVI